MIKPKAKIKMPKFDNRKSGDLKDRSINFSLSIIELIDSRAKDGVSNALYNQIIRSATSVGANIHEAKGASSRKDFKKFYEIALKSTNETEYWLIILRESGKCTAKEIEPILDECQQLAKILASSVIKIKQNL